MIQRKKSDVYSQLPAKIIRRLPVEISPLQKQVYTKAARSWLVECQGKPVTEIHNALSALLRLRQVISTPSCIVGEYGNPMPDDSAKLDTAMELIQSSSERIVVMSLFRGTVTALSERLSKAGIAHNVLMGGMGSGHAAECQRQINSGEIRVLVCTMQSGGTGLNLIGASTMIVIEEHYNPMIMWQCVDRIHRIGQTQQVYITILSCPGTVDDLVNKIVQRKITMSEAVLAESLTKNLQEFLS
jgi:SNF2 family DNA or RNA helicase